MARASFWVITLTGLLVAGLWFAPRLFAPPQLGQAYGVMAALYAGLMLAGAWFGSQHELMGAFSYVVVLSICLALPDVLLAQSGVLAFPQLGGERWLGRVPVYTTALWAAGLIVVLWLAELAHVRAGVLGIVAALVAGFVVFAASDWLALRLALWAPRGVDTRYGVAVYALAAKTALALAAWLMFTQVQQRTIFGKAAGAAVVALFYAGAAVAANYAVPRLL